MKKIIWIAAAALLLTVQTLPCAEPQGETGDLDLAKAYDASVAALNAGNFDVGLNIVQKVIEETGDSSLSLYGPAFGHFHYLLGMLLIGKKEYRAALEPLRAAAEDFGNDKREKGQAPNLFQNQARMQRGMCLQALGNYPEAAQHFEAVLAADKGAEPKINRFTLELNLARCDLRTGKEEEGKKKLSRLLESGKLPPEAVQDAFTALADESIEGIDVMALIRKHSVALTGNPKMNARFAALGSRCLSQGDPVQALVWYHLMSPPGKEQRDLEGEIARLAQQEKLAEERGRRDLAEKTQQSAGEKRQTLEEARQRHAETLLGMASAHYQIGSLSAAYALFRELLATFPHSGKRAEILHNAILCATSLELWDDAMALGTQFSAEFPGDPLQAGVSRVLAQVVFRRGDYAASLRMAGESRGGVPSASAERAALDFVVAAALVKLERWDEAERELLAFVAAHPESPSATDARYFLGVILSKRAKWDEARRWLAEHVEQSREAPSRPNALYLLSLGWLVQDQPLQALFRANQLLAEHRFAPETAHAHNVKGDAQLAMGESYETVSASYLRAREAAQQAGPALADAGAYALKQLVALAVQAERWEDAASRFGEFARQFPESRWRAGATVSASQALAATGKGDEALQLLEELIAFEAGRERSSGLEIAVRHYCDFLAAHVPPAEQLARLNGFAAAKSSPALQAMLLVGQIDAAGERGETADPARLGVLFDELGKLCRENIGEIPGYAIVRLARWQGEQGKEVSEALRLYEEVLRRREPGEAYGLALAESAALLHAADPARYAALAEERFREALGAADADEVREQAVLGLARLATAGKQWKEGESRWIEYLDHRDWKRARPEANFGYASCLDGQGRTEEALKVYVSVYANFAGALDLATAAYLRASDILWNTGRQVDALKVLQDMLRRMERNPHPNVAKAEAKFFQWRDQYVAGQKR